MINIIAIMTISIILAIINHELCHLFIAKYYGYEAKLCLIKAKEKKSIGIFGYLPGVMIKADNNITKKRMFAISILPFFPTFLTIFIGYLLIIPNDIETFSFKHIVILITTLSFSIIAALLGSKSDIEDYKDFVKNKIDTTI